MPIWENIKPWVACGLIAGLVTACATDRPPSPLSGTSNSRTYGYVDRATADGRHEIFYTTPPIITAPPGPERVKDIEAARRLANDLALWRGAELIRAGGGHAVSIIVQSTDIIEDIDRAYFKKGPFFHFGYGHPFGHPHRNLGLHHFPNRYDPYYTRHSIQAAARIVVTRADEGDGRPVAELIAEMATKYPEMRETLTAQH